MLQMNDNKDEGMEEDLFFSLSSHDYTFFLFYFTSVSLSLILQPQKLKYTSAPTFFSFES